MVLLVAAHVLDVMVLQEPGNSGDREQGEAWVLRLWSEELVLDGEVACESQEALASALQLEPRVVGLGQAGFVAHQNAGGKLQVAGHANLDACMYLHTLCEYKGSSLLPKEIQLWIQIKVDKA